jgi:hypothetical protein
MSNSNVAESVVDKSLDRKRLANKTVMQQGGRKEADMNAWIDVKLDGEK